jgi:hypothetical protein
MPYSRPGALPVTLLDCGEHAPDVYTVRVLHDPNTGERIFQVPDEEAAGFEVRPKKASPHFPRFVQLAADSRVCDWLLALRPAELRVLLVLVLGMDMRNRVALPPAEIATRTGLNATVVGRALTALWREHDLLRLDHRAGSVRVWMVSMRLAYRGPARVADQVEAEWNRLWVDTDARRAQPRARSAPRTTSTDAAAA